MKLHCVESALPEYKGHWWLAYWNQFTNAYPTPVPEIRQRLEQMIVVVYPRKEE